MGIRDQTKLRGTLKQMSLVLNLAGNKKAGWNHEFSRVIYVPLQAVRCVICGENPKECSLFYGIWIPIVDRNDSLKTHIQIKTHTQRIKF